MPSRDASPPRDARRLGFGRTVPDRADRATRALRRGTLAGFAAALALAATACNPTASSPDGGATGDPSSPPWFEECASSRGIDFTLVSGHDGRRPLMPEIMCGGVALFDADGDGDLDAYFVQAGRIEAEPASRPPNKLYRNRGDGRFDDVTETSGAGDRGYGMGVATGDYDGDGDLDLYVTNLGPNVLLRNDGDCKFTDVTAAAGVGDPSWGTSASFFDYDRDGDLDLYVTNYLKWSVASERHCESVLGGADYCSPKAYAAPAPDTLYRNDGGGRFTDVSETAGLRTAYGNGLGVVTGDFTGDSLPDVFVANDGTPNQLWVQRGDGTFADEAVLRGCAFDMQGFAKAGMGVVAEDLDDDGDLDILVQNLAGESDSVFVNDGPVFRDRTGTAGLGAASRRFTRFGVGARDFDCDGWLDLFVVAGRVSRERAPLTDDPFAEPHLAFRGTGPCRFEELRPAGGTSAPLHATSRGAAFGDIDGDGGVDVLVANRDAPAHLLRNVVPERGPWFTLRVVERNGSDALGAAVTMRITPHPGSSALERRILRIVRTDGSYCSASDPRIHVGLASADAPGDVVVRWTDGSTETFASPALRAVTVLRRGEGDRK